jgi:hypothetical protein
VVSEFFVREQDYVLAVSAYNALLYAADLGANMKDAQDKGLDLGKCSPDVPPMFLSLDNALLARAMRLAFKDASVVSLVADHAGVPPKTLRENWAAWCEKGNFVRHWRQMPANLPKLP